MVAVRDPNGFRPLVIGRMKGRGTNGTDGFCIASETCALDMCKAEYVTSFECVAECVAEGARHARIHLPSLSYRCFSHIHRILSNLSGI